MSVVRHSIFSIVVDPDWLPPCGCATDMHWTHLLSNGRPNIGQCDFCGATWDVEEWDSQWEAAP